MECVAMKLSQRVKPISELKANAPTVIRELEEGGEPYFITVHGEAKAVLQDIQSFEATQETLALLKILALSAKEVEEGEVQSLDEAFADHRKRVAR